MVRILALAVLCFSALSGFALAHSPAGVTVMYDENTMDLTVTVNHQVDNPSTHYAKQVTVKKGTTVLIDTSYTSQPDRSSFTYRYNLPQLKDTSGEVRADVQCNQIGSRSGSLMLTSSSAQGTPGTAASTAPTPAKSTVYGYVALVAIGFAAARFLR